MRPANLALAMVVSVVALACGSPTRPPVPPADPTVRWVDGGAGRLRVSDGGVGAPTIVLLHGLGGDISVWAAQLEHLRQRHRVIAYDQRGHGSSAAAGAGGYSVDALTDDLEAVERSLGLGPVVLVGHSMSGAVISTYAGRHPDAVAGLVYLDAIGDLAMVPEAEVEPYVAAARAARDADARQAFFQGDLAKARPSTKVRVDAGLAAMDAAAFGDLFAAIAGLRDGKARLGAYAGPAVAIEDATAHSPDQASSALGIPRVDLAGVSHWLHLDDPDAVNQAIDAFLETLPPAPR